MQACNVHPRAHPPVRARILGITSGARTQASAPSPNVYSPLPKCLHPLPKCSQPPPNIYSLP